MSGDPYQGPFIVGSMFPRARRSRSFKTFNGALAHLTSESSNRGIPHQIHDGHGRICVRAACYSDGSIFIQYRRDGEEEMEAMPREPLKEASTEEPTTLTPTSPRTATRVTRLKKVRTEDALVEMGRGRKPLKVRGKVTMQSVTIKNPALHAARLRTKRLKRLKRNGGVR